MSWSATLTRSTAATCGNNVVVAIIQGLLAQDIAALRFNFRGAGRSTGTYSEGVGERDDALAAFAALHEHDAIDPARVAIAGYSFGANIALSLAPYLDDALGVAAVAPPLQGLARPDILDYAKPKLIVAGDGGCLRPRRRGPRRRRAHGG